MAQAETSSDPRAHTQRMEKVFHDTAAHLRKDVEVIQDPRARALFETARRGAWRPREGVPRLRQEGRTGLELNPLPIRALASDYDGTLATHGGVADATILALRRLKASGRWLVMVTGRELPDLRRVFPDLPLFDLVVAENGALLYRPDFDEETPLAPPPPAAFIDALKARKVEPLAVGRSIVATADENAAVVDEALRAVGLDWRLILNKDSVMCLPPGVDKASGLAAALAALELAASDVLGVGDAENDEAFLAACGVGAAVANALPELKAVADIVAPEEAGAGVAWLIERLLQDPQGFVDLARSHSSPLAG